MLSGELGEVGELFGDGEFTVYMYIIEVVEGGLVEEGLERFNEIVDGCISC